jgi:hypothetical protein
MGRRNPQGIRLALRTAIFALIGFQMAKIGASLLLLGVWHAIAGDLGAIALTVAGAGVLIITVIALRETADGLKAVL